MSQQNHNIFIEPIRTNISEYDTRKEATAVQSLLWDDFSRLHNADLEALRSLCNPDDDALIDRQAHRLSHPPEQTRYYGIYENGDPDMIGMTKIGPWTDEYEQAFASRTLTAFKSILKLNNKAVGLDAFALKTADNRSQLTHAALQSIYFDDRIVPVDAELKAAVDVNDDELTAAFDELGAAGHDRIGRIRLADWTRDYTLRTLPAKQTIARLSW